MHQRSPSSPFYIISTEGAFEATCRSFLDLAFGVLLPDAPLLAVSLEMPIRWANTGLRHTKPPANFLTQRVGTACCFSSKMSPSVSKPSDLAFSTNVSTSLESTAAVRDSSHR